MKVKVKLPQFYELKALDNILSLPEINKAVIESIKKSLAKPKLIYDIKTHRHFGIYLVDGEYKILFNRINRMAVLPLEDVPDNRETVQMLIKEISHLHDIIKRGSNQ